jgi:hypothetical protein
MEYQPYGGFEVNIPDREIIKEEYLGKMNMRLVSFLK